MMGNEIFPDVSDEQWQVSDDTIELPRAALIENSEGGLVRIVFVAFDRLESILKPIDTWTETKHPSINAGKFRTTAARSCRLKTDSTPKLFLLRLAVSKQFRATGEEAYAEQ